MRSLRFPIASFVLATLVACASDGGPSATPVTPTPKQPTDPGSAISIGLPGSTISVMQGQSTSLTVNLTRSNFTGTVALSTDAGPSGITATFGAALLSGSTASTTMTIAVASNASVGSFTLTVRGRSPGVSDAVATLPITVTAAPVTAPPKTIALTFCASDYPVWIATQNDQAAWVKAAPDVDGVVRVTMGVRGGVAALYDGADLEVVYGTAAELAAYYQSCTGGDSHGTKTIYGSVAGFVTGTAAVALGTTTTAAAPSDPFTLDGVADGSLDLIGVIAQLPTAPNFDLLADAVIVRRGQNIANGGAIPVLDFAGSGATTPALGRLTIAGLSNGAAAVSVAFQTTTGASGVTYSVDHGAAIQNYMGIPSSLTTASDLHTVSIADVPANPNDPVRYASVYTRDVSERSVQLGPPVGVPTVSAVAGSSSPARWSAQFATQLEYGTYAAVGFVQDVPGASRTASIITTTAYMGSSAGSTWSLSIPDLSAAGFNPAWGLSSAPPDWFVTVAGGADFSQFALPTDGAILYGSTRLSAPSSSSRVAQALARHRRPALLKTLSMQRRRRF